MGSTTSGMLFYSLFAYDTLGDYSSSSVAYIPTYGAAVPLLLFPILYYIFMKFIQLVSGMWGKTGWLCQRKHDSENRTSEFGIDSSERETEMSRLG